MKKHLMLLSMLLCMCCATAQTKKTITKKTDLYGTNKNRLSADASIKYVKSNATVTDTLHNDEPISYFTPKKDTLYLRNCDLGMTIVRVWKENKFSDTPVIFVVDVLPKQQNLSK